MLDAGLVRTWLTPLPPPGQSLLAFTREQRVRWGFRSDASYVSALGTGKAAGLNFDYGLWLTAAERDELNFRQQVMNVDVPSVKKVLAGRASAAGHYLDPATGRLTVLLAGADATAEADIRATAHYSDRLAFRQVKYSESQLAGFDKAVGALRDSTDSSIRGVMVSIPLNALIVDLDDTNPNPSAAGRRRVDDAGIRAELAKLVPPDALIVRQADVATSGTNNETGPPWRGGMRIVSSDGHGCQAGFVVQKDEPVAPDSYWIMTAGHCANGVINMEWRNAATGAGYSTGYGIGWTRGACNHQGCAADVQVINMNQNYDTREVWQNSTTKFAILGQQAAAGDNVGDTVCGSTVMRRPGTFYCGQLTALSYDMTVDGWTRPYQRVTNLGSTVLIDGDSGGPWFRNFNLAVGIHTGRCGGALCYSHIHDAIRASGMRAVKSQP
ncbi:hypothetical protein GCM10023107_68900 [Actinoplanes octamycinicus]|nr:hypothetical protein Aoc01nite_25810 [Actinoplanes octamycinicus]